MSDLNPLVSVAVTLESAPVSVESFGTALVLGHTAALAQGEVRTYEADDALTSLVSDGIPTTHQIYKIVTALLSADTRVSKVKVAGRAAAFAQVTHVTPSVVENNTVYSCRVNGTTASFASDSSATLAEICTGLAAAIDALPLVTATSDGTKVIVSTTLADSVAIVNTPVMVKIDDQTADAGIAADLAAALATDDAWYLLCIDSPSNAETLLANTWVTANERVLARTISGSRAGDVADTTDTLSTLKGASAKRTFAVYHSDQTSRAAETLAGVMLPHHPSYGKTWAMKTLSGVTVERLSSTFKSAVSGKGGIVYETRGGVNITRDGWMCDGNRFIDQTTGLDALVSGIQTRIYAAMLQDLPFTDESADGVCGEILAELQTFVSRGFLSSSPKPTCTYKPVSQLSPSDRAARRLTDITFSATTAGRVHSVSIRGKVTV